MLLFPTVAWISRAVKHARLIHSYHKHGYDLSQEDGNNNRRNKEEACHGWLNWVRKTRHKLRGWVNDCENPWVNDSENPQQKPRQPSITPTLLTFMKFAKPTAFSSS